MRPTQSTKRFISSGRKKTSAYLSCAFSVVTHTSSVLVHTGGSMFCQHKIRVSCKLSRHPLLRHNAWKNIKNIYVHIHDCMENNKHIYLDKYGIWFFFFNKPLRIETLSNIWYAVWRIFSQLKEHAAVFFCVSHPWLGNTGYGSSTSTSKPCPNILIWPNGQTSTNRKFCVFAAMTWGWW